MDRQPPYGAGYRRDVALERRLANAISGEVAFDAATRGRFAADASIYQIMPAGVAFPRTIADVEAILQIARENGTSVIARGGGTSQNGQPIGEGLIVDFSRHLNQIVGYDKAAGTVVAQPGLVLERLNTRIRSDGWFYPVEPSTATRCTIGGMTGNNSCGARSIRYGKMVDNVLAIDALLADATPLGFARSGNASGELSGGKRAKAIAPELIALAERERQEIEQRFPKVQRRVGGYNLDELIRPQPNLPGLLVGSEGTLAVFTGVTLQLSPLPTHRVIGVCHFPTFRSAMETTRHLVELGPTAVELVDNNVLVFGADIPLFQRTLADITRGKPNCLLLVEFAGPDLVALKTDLKRLGQCMADHGHPDSVVEVVEPARQRQIWDMREACLNIITSMKGDAKAVSFIEDCAVPLEHLADYTDAITELFARHGTTGTWYAHASVGCLHVRPILDMKQDRDVKAMRAIAEEACALVRRFKGSYSGEHGDGISRSEFIAPMFGERLSGAFEQVKNAFDPERRLNPGKIVQPLRFDDRALMRFKPGYAASEPVRPVLDWSEWGSFAGAVEMCNNNGTCRKLADGAMCPSYRATREEQHVTRGRANTLRLAVSGQLGPEGLVSDDVKAALELCVSCKACKRECPTGVDMARMKIEALHQARVAGRSLTLRERLIAYLPRYAPYASRVPWLMNLRDRSPGAAIISEHLLGFTARRPLPVWRKPWHDELPSADPENVKGDGRDLVLFADTFNRYFEPETMAAGKRILTAAGFRLHRAEPSGDMRPLCCGRTFLAVGLVDEARAEARRLTETLAPFVARGARIAGLEPSCLSTLKDELPVVLPGADSKLIAQASVMAEECLAEAHVSIPFEDQGGRVAHLHGHCHQKALGTMGALESCLRKVPGLDVKPIETSCCGGAGAFGYEAEHIEVSQAMAELALFPALRKAGSEDLIVASGTSCRHQIADGLGRQPVHLVRALAGCLPIERQSAPGPGGGMV